ncbi:MAG: GspE/PulE family protein [Planctomycetota bacterium]|jgi:type IV pilus assembly protein PilB
MNAAPQNTGTSPLILQLLLRKGLLEPGHQEIIREAQQKEKLSLEEILIRKGLCDEQSIAAAYSEHFLIPPFIPEQGGRPDPQLSRLLPEKLCRDHLIAPVVVREKTLDVAFFTPNELHLIDELQLLSGLSVRPLIAPLSAVEGLLGTYFDDSAWPGSDGPNSASFEELDEIEELGEPAERTDEELIHLDQPPPPGRDGRIIRYVNQVFEQALRVGASDIHIEPFEDRWRVRLRIDGNLNEIAPAPQSLFTAIVSRIKVLAKMDIAEKRLPQDGAVAMKTGERRVDMRANTVPTVHGEKVVLRILDRSAVPLRLSDLGLDERQSSDLTKAIQMPHGLALVTGPTGSGKSTTLYACLNLLNKPDDNICTVEDPVEYKFMGINQVQVKTQVGLTFANALRSFLRQDPDIIMVGEVRDAETAQICLRAALTGHFVLSTLHTNDALAAIDRLQDMAVEPFLLASTLRALVAQRLIRRLCPRCRSESQCDPETARRHGLRAGETLYRPAGCPDCRNAGYRGRVGIFEVIRITDEMADLIQRRASLPELRQAATQQGMKLLATSAFEKVRSGITSLEEALSVSTGPSSESWDTVLDSLEEALATQ